MHAAVYRDRAGYALICRACEARLMRRGILVAATVPVVAGGAAEAARAGFDRIIAALDALIVKMRHTA